MDKAERAAIEELRKAQYEADLFWDLAGLVRTIDKFCSNDAERIAMLQNTVNDMRKRAVDYRCQRSSIDELKDQYRALMSIDRDLNDFESMQRNAIMADLEKRGVSDRWYIDEG